MPTEDGTCPQWPDRCCFCLTKRAGVVLTGLFSILSDFVFIVTCVYASIDNKLWSTGKIFIRDSQILPGHSGSFCKNFAHFSGKFWELTVVKKWS